MIASILYLLQVSVADQCKEYVSISELITNATCYDTCKTSRDCVILGTDGHGCYGDLMYGSPTDSESVHLMPPNAEAQDCQLLCQNEPTCAFFAFSKDALDGNHACLLKSRDELDDATTSTENCPDSVISIKSCSSDNAGCVYHSEEFITGPKYCGYDSWITDASECPSSAELQEDTTDVQLTSNSSKLRSSATDRTSASAFTCPDGRLIEDHSLEFVYVHDFSGSNVRFGGTVKLEMTDAFTQLSEAFGGNAKFSIVIAVDKNQERGGETLELTCYNPLNGLGKIEDQTLIDDLDELGTLSNYQSNYSRLNVLDSFIHQLNNWAGDGPSYNEETGETVVRILATSTDDCVREAGLWFQIAQDKQDQWAEDRGLTFPLTGGEMLDCQDHDYPTIEEVATEAALNEAQMLFLVKTSESTCQDSTQYDPSNGFNETSQYTIEQWWYHTDDVFQELGVKTILDPTLATQGMEQLGEMIIEYVTDLMCNTTTTTTTTAATTTTTTAATTTTTTTEATTTAATTTTTAATTTTNTTTTTAATTPAATTTTTAATTATNTTTTETTTTTLDGFLCPEGNLISDLSLEYVHVQDMSKAYASEGATIRDQLIGTFSELNRLFKGAARFSFVGAVDKDLDEEFECNDFGMPLSPIDNEFLLNDLDKLTDASNYFDTEARPDVFDAVLHQLNHWAGSGPTYNEETGETSIRVISTSTDNCARESGLWYGIPEDKQAQFISDRGLTFPLSGGEMNDCHDHDYPTLEEVAAEAQLNGARMIFLVDGVTGDKCQNADYYHSPNYNITSQFTIGDWWANATSIFERHGVYTVANTDGNGMDKLSETIIDSVTNLICTATTMQPTATDAPDQNVTNSVTPAPLQTTQTTTEIVTTTTSTSEGRNNIIAIAVGSAIGGLVLLGAVVGGVFAARKAGLIGPGRGDAPVEYEDGSL